MKDRTIAFIPQTGHGIGHISRCLALADVHYNWNAIFFASENYGLNLINYPKEIVADKIFDKKIDEYIKKIKPDVIVIDLLDFNRSVFGTWRKFAQTICLFDFAASIDKKLFDLVINTNPSVPLEGKDTLSGTAYVPLSHDLLEYRRTYKVQKHVKTAFISLGGSDPKDQTQNILEAFKSLDLYTYVVIGPGFNKKNWKQRKNIRFVESPSRAEFHSLMSLSDIAITTAGNTMYEVSCIGIPNIVICNHQNHLGTATYFAQKEAVINLGIQPETKVILDSIKILVNDAEGRAKLSTIAKSLVDGYGADRIKKIISSKL